MSASPSTRSGFTFIELLVVSVIMAILVALMLPAVNQTREAARRNTCRNNMRQLVLALHTYHDQHAMLPAGTVNATRPIRNVPAGFHHNWIVAILPQLDQRPLAQMFDPRKEVYDAAHFEPRSMVLPLLMCPSEDGPIHASQSTESLEPALCSYAGNHHPWEAPIDIDNRGVLYLNSYLPLTRIPDGTSHTIVIGEFRRAADDLGWASGTRATLRNTWLPPNQTPGGSVYYNDSKFHNLALSDQGFAGWTREETSDEALPDDVNTQVTDIPLDAGDGSDAKLGMSEDVPQQQRGLPPDVKAMLRADPRLIVGGFGSPHEGGTFACTADGAVRFVNETINAHPWHQLGDRADGELPLEW